MTFIVNVPMQQPMHAEIIGTTISSQQEIRRQHCHYHVELGFALFFVALWNSLLAPEIID